MIGMQFRAFRCFLLASAALLLLVSFHSQLAYAAGASDNDLYGILGLEKTATKTEIKKAFRRITRENHPDIKVDFKEKEEATAYMAKVLRAYSVLSDEEKRSDYDEFGKIPGEAPIPGSQTPEDLFKHYHQHSPIFSKSKTIESMGLLDRLLHFRGQRVFMIHIYDDSCVSCRWFSGPWEIFYHSSMVEAGAVEMFRIDAESAEGQAAIAALGIRYSHEPIVFALVNGKQWPLHGLTDAVSRKNRHMATSLLIELAMNFFYDTFREINGLKIESVDDILQWLGEPREPNQIPRVLIHTLEAESIPLAIQSRWGNRVIVRNAPRDALLEFLEGYCGMEVDVRDRYGDTIPTPEFILLSEETIPLDERHSEFAEKDTERQEHVCPKVHIGASASLTYDRASKFVAEYVKSGHEGMEGVPRVDVTSFIDVCRGNCLLWVRPECANNATNPDSGVVHLLKNNFLSFQTGYLCLDEEPQLKEAFKNSPSTHTVFDENSGPLFVAIKESSDLAFYVLRKVLRRPYHLLVQGDLDEALSEVVLEENPQDSENIVVMDSAIPLGTTFKDTGFTFSWYQTFYMFFLHYYAFVQPYISNTLPFVVMYFLHMRMNKGRNNEENNAQEGTASPGESSNRAHAANDTSSPSTTSATKKKEKGEILPFSPSDLENAKKGKGFLILLLGEGLTINSKLALPSICSDKRFCLRGVLPDNAEYQKWKSFALKGESPSEEVPLYFIGIRCGKMKAAVKNPSCSTENFFHDLLDGSLVLEEELP